VKVISNSGPLIVLGKLGIMELLFQLYGQITIPRAVYLEVVNQGIEVGASDAIQTELAVTRGQFSVVEIEDADVPDSVRTPTLD
jgi:predicted nucleic acid-binding protein